jgi:folate-dependent phosphoribosylglycinamide formyltransferase PurN
MTAPPQTPRLVVLTGDGPEHHYVTNRLCAELPIHEIVVDTRHRPPSLRRAFRGGVLVGFSRIGLFAFRRLVRDETARSAALRRILSSELSEGFTQEDLVRRVEGVNSPEARTVIAEAQPDALLVFGTSIVSAETLALARDRVVNLHTGVSPRYRGTDCAFWPVANREPEWIGATVHECTAAIDGGQIFGVAPADWRPNDRLHGLFARAVECGAGLYVEVMRRYLRDGALRGERQDLSEGAEYRGYMRTLGPELRARVALRRGLLRTTEAPILAPPAANSPARQDATYIAT